MVKEPPPPFCSSSRVFVLDDIDMMNFRCCCCCCLPLGGATVESTQNAPREIVTSVSTTRGDGRVLDQLHKIPSQIDVVSGTCHRRK